MLNASDCRDSPGHLQICTYLYVSGGDINGSSRHPSFKPAPGQMSTRVD